MMMEFVLPLLMAIQNQESMANYVQCVLIVYATPIPCLSIYIQTNKVNIEGTCVQNIKMYLNIELAINLQPCSANN